MSKPIVIAVIDDDASVREAMKDLIALLGYDTESFSSAEEFLCSERFGEVSCLVTDVQMPGMSGLQLFDRIRTGQDRKSVIFVTAFPQAAVRERVLRDGAIGYLTKPLRVDSLVACLDRATRI